MITHTRFLLDIISSKANICRFQNKSISLFKFWFNEDSPFLHFSLLRLQIVSKLQNLTVTFFWILYNLVSNWIQLLLVSSNEKKAVLKKKGTARTVYTYTPVKTQSSGINFVILSCWFRWRCFVTNNGYCLFRVLLYIILKYSAKVIVFFSFGFLGSSLLFKDASKTESQFSSYYKKKVSHNIKSLWRTHEMAQIWYWIASKFLIDEKSWQQTLCTMIFPSRWCWVMTLLFTNSASIFNLAFSSNLPLSLYLSKRSLARSAKIC